MIPNQPVMGFDTGTGNTLLDQWIEKHLGIPYDKNGEWAATGQINEVLLDNLLEESFSDNLHLKVRGGNYLICPG
ncbi:anhydro-N-acetylmuramic acid kinase [Rodentibacter pneumotropicus]|uniref:Anhydro-N-acetylmuramic acid kinase n=1 Tax=Rodentibacter pneumotropicus TaxID=758 RepID=A0A3S4TXR6_9PAST|nr:anhydro-N-acetylmuramic acid kinase [Rodentibacter pneumotropicus]